MNSTVEVLEKIRVNVKVGFIILFGVLLFLFGENLPSWYRIILGLAIAIGMVIYAFKR